MSQVNEKEKIGMFVIKKKEKKGGRSRLQDSEIHKK